MPEPRNQRAGAAFFTAVLVLAVIGAIASVYLWRHGIQSRRDRDARAAARWAAIRVESRLPAARLAAPVRVAVLHDPASDRWFNGAAPLDTITNAWITTLRTIGADAAAVDPGNSAAIRAVDVLVVPSQPCLGMAARAAVDDVLARGGGVITSWLTGTRNGVCGDAGYAFLTRVTAASRVDTLDRRARTLVTLPDGGALAADLPPGATFEVLSAHDGAVRRVGRDAYYSDGVLNPAAASAQAGLDGAITHTAVGGGRAVYWGFDLARVVARPWDRAVAQLLLRNSVAWAAGDPIVSLAPWPAGRRAAVVVVQQVDGPADDASLARDTVQQPGGRRTFLFATNTAHDRKDIVRRLAASGEVASRPDDELRISRTDEEQTEKFRTMRGDLADLLGHQVAGMMPPMERIDPLLALSWARAGGSYLLAGNGARSASPELLAVDSALLVLIPRVADDDAAALRASTTTAVSLDASYRSAFAKLRALGGLYVMRHHASLLARADLAPALMRATRLATADSTIWVATARDVASWWMARSRITIATTRQAGGAVNIRVGNTGASAVDGAVLRIAAGPGWTVSGVTGAAVGADRGDNFELLLPQLAAHSTHTVELQFAAGNGSDAR